MNRSDRLQTSQHGRASAVGRAGRGLVVLADARRAPAGTPGREGLYNSRAVLDDLSREVLYFAPAAGPLPETGLDMKINKLAEAGTAGGQDGVKRIENLKFEIAEI